MLWYGGYCIYYLYLHPFVGACVSIAYVCVLNVIGLPLYHVICFIILCTQHICIWFWGIHGWWLWASYQIRKITCCACTWNAGSICPAIDFKGNRWLAIPACATHLPWCMSGSLTRGSGENVPGIPGACATLNFPYLVRGPWLLMRNIQQT